MRARKMALGSDEVETTTAMAYAGGIHITDGKALNAAPPLTLRDKVLSTRGAMSLLLFFGLFVAHSLRVLMSSTVGPIAAEFRYSNQTMGVILASFFIGYVLLQLVGGYLATRYGGVLVIGFGLLLASIFTLLTPLVAHNLGGLIVMRILTGLSESVVYPSVHALMGMWAPRNERSILVSVVWSGAYIGTTVTLPVSGLIISNTDPTASTLLRGWPGVFYVFAIFGIAWSLAWLLYASSSPETHHYISPLEREYIITQRGETSSSCANASASTAGMGATTPTTAATTTTRAPAVFSQRSQPPPMRAVPWRALLTHPAVLALAVGHTSHNWLYYVLLTWMPEFLRQQLHYDVKHVGMVAALPYLSSFVFSIAAGFGADYVLTRRLASRLAVRKTAQTIGEVLPAITIVLAGFVDSAPAAVTMLVLSVGLGACANSGFGSNALDIAPQYAGILFGFGNTMATIPGVIAPIVVGALVSPPHDDIAHWRTAFILSSAICLAGWAVFVVYAQAETVDFSAQPAMKPPTSPTPDMSPPPSPPPGHVDGVVGDLRLQVDATGGLATQTSSGLHPTPNNSGTHPNESPSAFVAITRRKGANIVSPPAVGSPHDSRSGSGEAEGSALLARGDLKPG